MADKAYEYMDWPRIEAIVYGEEASPRDVMQPRVTEDGVLIQGLGGLIISAVLYPILMAVPDVRQTANAVNE